MLSLSGVMQVHLGTRRQNRDCCAHAMHDTCMAWAHVLRYESHNTLCDGFAMLRPEFVKPTVDNKMRTQG